MSSTVRAFLGGCLRGPVRPIVPIALVALAALTAAGTASAQPAADPIDTAAETPGAAPDAAYPERPIDLYIGSAPAGSTDAMGRVLARTLGDVLGQPVVVHNTPGAGGAVMAAQLRHAPADGYHLGMTISHAYSGAPIVMPESSEYAVGDFTHLASVSKGQCALVTHAGQPYRTLDDLIEAARRGDAPVFASQSPLTRIVADYIASVAGVRFRVITVQGGGETMQAILGRHADFGFSGGPHIDFVEAGQMRVLAAAEDARLATSPDVPTLRELGYDISSCALFVVSAPPGLPPAIGRTLASALEQAIGSAEMQALIANLEFPPHYLGPEGVTEALQAESAMLTRVARRLGAAAVAEGELSPWFMPRVAAALLLAALIAIGLGRLLDARARAARGGPVDRSDRLAAAAIAPVNWRYAGAGTAVLVTAFVSMTAFGYLPGTAIIVAGFLLLGRSSLVTTVICAALLPAALWFLFSRLLGYPLP